MYLLFGRLDSGNGGWNVDSLDDFNGCSPPYYERSKPKL